MIWVVSAIFDYSRYCSNNLFLVFSVFPSSYVSLVSCHIIDVSTYFACDIYGLVAPLFK